MSNELTVNRTTALNIIQSENQIANIKEFSKYMAGSSMVPKHFHSKPYDCFMLVTMASQWGMNPLAIAPEVFPVNGNMTYGSKLIIAVIMQSGLVEPRPYYQAIGNWSQRGKLINNRFQNESGLGVKVGFKFKGDEDVTYGEAIYLADQTIRNSPLWKSNPYQQLCYLGAKFWSRLYMPAATMGLYSEDELNDEGQVTPEKDITPTMSGGDYFSQQEPVLKTVPVVDMSEPKQAHAVDQGIIDIADSIKEEIIQPEVVQADAPSAMQSDAPEVDANGVEFNPEIHTGTKLKDGSWRLNKKGRELTEPKEESQALNMIVKPVHMDAIDYLGTDQPIKVKSYDEKTGKVKLEGFADEFEMVMDGEVMLEVVDNQPSEFDESFNVLCEQKETLKKKNHNALAFVGADHKEGVKNALSKWDAHLEGMYNETSRHPLTPEAIEALKAANEKYAQETQSLIDSYKEKRHNPFMGG